MIFSRKYNIVNNAAGWGVFLVSLICYWLTLEPTASYWDCGEFIIQANKLEIGHPPGNPIFMLTARFFANFAPDASKVALMVNAMSGLLSALTILLLFWTITQLVRRLIVRDGNEVEPTLTQYLVIMGSGVVGALAYAWSDTFWFSAVEGEVYAFSSFCTALVFWLILKWENRAENPDSDKYLILIAYIIGVSVAVHLLNLLCIPAIVLVFAYKRIKGMNLKKSLLALLVSFGIVVFVLYGLVPGFIKVAQWFELICVNSLGMPFQSGLTIYTCILISCMAWTLWEQYVGKSELRIKISVWLMVLLTGGLMLINIWVSLILTVALAAVLFAVYGKRPLPRRIIGVASWSIMVIFIGYASYALILIRSNADTPMNQNSPDNVFSLASYLNREQYGSRPLFYGETPYSQPLRKYGYTEKQYVDEEGNPQVGYVPYNLGTVRDKKGKKYAQNVVGATPRYFSGFCNANDSLNDRKKAAEGKEYYAFVDYDYTPVMQDEMNMYLPRMYSSDPTHIEAYKQWTGMNEQNMNIVIPTALDDSGRRIPDPYGQQFMPTFGQNLRYFLDYQLNHMYMRYFMWNFAGRQNDICNQQGELDAGNWISGIPFIDNPRLGDQSLLPDDLGKGNAGHNVFYMLPLLLGIIGLLWQAFAGRRGIEQFWVVFFLFFMTGIAIVLYLNQTPLQPRERDYAFAGSFYAFAIWIGMGVAGLWRGFLKITNKTKKDAAEKTVNATEEEEEQKERYINEPDTLRKHSQLCAVAACLLGVIVPLQMVSQTWDDHNRSGRTAAYDYATNYLNSLEPNAIIFCNGDNDTFPLWYAQEVEGVRPDVKIINLSYLQSEWYANQQRMQSYNAAPVKFTAKPSDYAYDRLTSAQVIDGYTDTAKVDALTSLRHIYSDKSIVNFGGGKYVNIRYPKMYIPVNKSEVLKRGTTWVDKNETDSIAPRIEIDLTGRGYATLSELLMLDIIATNAADGWKRPIYWASTVPNSYHLGLTPYLKQVGMTYQLTPVKNDGTLPVRTSKALDVIEKYRWGVQHDGMTPYFDETASRMLYGVRSSIIRTAEKLITEGDDLSKSGNESTAKHKFNQALLILQKMEQKLPEAIKRYGLADGTDLGKKYVDLGKRLGRNDITRKGYKLMREVLARYANYIKYVNDVRSRFGNPALTYETSLMPYYYYHFVEIYEQAGGDMKALASMPELKGIDLTQLKNVYEQNMQSENSVSGSVDDIYAQIMNLAKDVKRLQNLSTEEYDKEPLELRQTDSIFLYTISLYNESGGDINALEQTLNEMGINIDRSTKLFDEYVSKHKQ